jgi:hypothetical protein
MNRKGVTYDVGTVTGMNWQPDYDQKLVRREREIIKRDLHCTAVRITGRDSGRFVVATDDALQQGLEVWLSPLLCHKRPEHMLPLVGPSIRPRLKKIDERDEGLQARRLIDQLTLLESAGVDGTFLSTFVFPINPSDDLPKYDLDRESARLVKSDAGGRHGVTYPDRPWEPKELFKAVATYDASDARERAEKVR